MNNMSEEMKIFYETFDKAVEGKIKSCFNCKHSVYHPPIPPSSLDFGTDAEAECTNKQVNEVWDEIEKQIEQYPHYEYGLEHYTAVHCPFYQALTDEERVERFWDYFHCSDTLMEREKVGERG